MLFACAHGKLDALQIVLEHSAHISLNASLPCDNSQGLTPLTVASITNNLSVCKLLVKSGADVNYVDSGGLCALHWAVLADNFNIVKFLLANGAKPDIMDSEVC